ncbi:hypothetical protein AB1Y20_020083 [Prymnesium parvum]|uniref:RING-type E3 ubiquitin transferase n=1 Tax=Prymnesium parvum TaxID=97485 RepID=A0AB34JTK8_PRYPA
MNVPRDRSSSGDVAGGLSAPKPSNGTSISPRKNLYNTFNEAELSEYLVYITCPICEEVVSNDPVFTPCHHTFCGDCIRQHILMGNQTCPECGEAVQLNQLEVNSMAVNLLKTFKTGCIYQANGCKWKGKIRDLTDHYKSCNFAVTHCPYGCGTKLEQHSLRKHMKECVCRPVNDCPCGRTFAFNRRAEHESGCLKFLQLSLPRALAEAEALTKKLDERQHAMRQLRREHVLADVQTGSWIASSMLLCLALVSTVGQLLRSDASLSLAIYLLVAVQTRLPDMLNPAAVFIGASMLADLVWFVLLGPFALFVHGLPISQTAASTCVDPLLALLPAGRAAYVAVLLVLKAVLLVPHLPLLGAFRALAAEAAERTDGAPPPKLVLPSAEARAEGRDCVSATIQVIGLLLLIASFWSCICRPDAGAMLGLLVLTALRESRLYFSRVAAGATLITLVIDWLWLRFQALPGEDLVGAMTSLSSLTEIVALIGGLPLQLQLGILSTFVTVPFKLLLLLLHLHLLCLPYVAEQQKFRFEVDEQADEPPTVASTPAEGTSLSHKRAARRRLERDLEALLGEAKRVVTLCFIGLLLVVAIGSVGTLAAMHPMEHLVLTMLAAYGCLRHSRLCDSQPDRCCALVDKAAVVLLPAVLTGALRLASSKYVRMPWGEVALLERVALVAMGASVLLLLLLLLSLLRMRWFLASLRHPAVGAASLLQNHLAARLRRLAFVGVGLSCLLGASATNADTALFALALFALTADGEAEALADLRLTPPPAGEAARPRLASCLAPDPLRRAGGLASVTALVAFTMLADVAWCASRLAAAAPPRDAIAWCELPLTLLQLLLKLSFIVTALHLRLVRSRAFPAEATRLSPEPAGGSLFLSGCTLLLLAACSASALRVLGDADADEALAVARLSAGPVGVLGVLACAVAMRSGGNFLPGLLSATALVTLLVGALWLSLAPPKLGFDALHALLDGQRTASLQELTPLVQLPAVLLMVQLLILLCVCIASMYIWVSDRRSPSSPTSRADVRFGLV